MSLFNYLTLDDLAGLPQDVLRDIVDTHNELRLFACLNIQKMYRKYRSSIKHGY